MRFIHKKEDIQIGIKIGSYTLKEIRESTFRKGKMLWILECECGRVIEVSPEMCIGKKPKMGICTCGRKGSPNDYISFMQAYKDESSSTDEKLEQALSAYREHLIRESAGNREISIDHKWIHDKQSFISWALNNGYQHRYVLNRKDRDMPYSEDNCFWSDKLVTTKSVQKKQEIPSIDKDDFTIWTGIDVDKLIEMIQTYQIEEDTLADLVSLSDSYNLNGGITSTRLRKHISKNLDSLLELVEKTISLVQVNNIRKDMDKINRVQELLYKSCMLIQVAKEEMEEQ